MNHDASRPTFVEECSWRATDFCLALSDDRNRYATVVDHVPL
jgi:hypothetical protein